MQEKYEQAIKATFKYLDDERSDAACVFAGSYAEAIKRHMKLLGFEVYCTSYSNYDDTVVVYPMQYNLPIHIWRK